MIFSPSSSQYRPELIKYETGHMSFSHLRKEDKKYV